MSVNSKPSSESDSTLQAQFSRIPELRLRFAKLAELVCRQKQRYVREVQRLKNKEPAAELTEDETYTRLTMDLPGVLPSDVKVRVQDDVLSIEASRKHMSIDGITCIKTESIARRFAVKKASTDLDKLETSLAHGVLTIKAPKLPATADVGDASNTNHHHTMEGFEVAVETSNGEPQSNVAANSNHRVTPKRKARQMVKHKK